MSSNNLVSVVMSTYNNEDTIETSISSLVNQSYKNIEILIMDDASTDNTYNICKKFEKTSSNVKIFRNQDNLGLTKSLNILVKKARGKYIARSDADDFSYTNRIEEQLNYILKKNLDACCTRAFRLNTKRKIPGYSYYIPLKILIKYKNPFVHGTLLIKKEVLQILNLYDENFIYAQDYKLFSDLLKNNFKILNMKIPLYELNTKNNISNIYKEQQKYFADCVRKDINPEKYI
jgi:glycosyltransferase involved in cell wall biosynthesis